MNGRLLVRCGLAFAALLTTLRAQSAEREPNAFARVIVDSVDLRTGPGISFRTIGTAHRGDTFALDGRPGQDFWLRVLTEDGRIVYILGSAVQPFEIDPEARDAPARPGFFAPPPLNGARAGLAIMAGAINIPTTAGRAFFGYFEARPSIVISSSLSLDGFVGISPTINGLEFLYGGGATVYFAPDWALCPYVTLGGGGLSLFPTNDSFVVSQQSVFIGRAGGGLLFAVKNRILVRFEATNSVLFTPDSYDNAQTYTGGLGVYF